jgi:hypothetical protein
VSKLVISLTLGESANMAGQEYVLTRRLPSLISFGAKPVEIPESHKLARESQEIQRNQRKKIMEAADEEAVLEHRR